MLLVGAAALLAVAVTARASDRSEETKESENRSKDIIENLRRQLMRHNYDYSHETPPTTEPHRRADADVQLDKPHDNISINNNYYLTKPTRQRNNNHENSDIEDVMEETGNKTKPEHPVSERDLFYYVDDEKLISKKSDDRKYKTLKVRHQFRRSGQNQYIQEEGEEGVAIVSLHKAPFPDLRLPNSRRQYQHDHGQAAADEEELPPPPVDDSDR
ncbi:uncharacterized protein LOC123877942 [Maniola jurtina]|uniref:uncharacterized protein LOC123877942 n=1 Tax=Maniola jurtina TaxID=191418 RepID=UPI001E688EFB|nr:uncharacterized protein LOC123877942 [Maniola jurtina]